MFVVIEPGYRQKIQIMQNLGQERSIFLKNIEK